MTEKTISTNPPLISDDELLLYFYQNELESSRQAEILAAIKNHPEIARRYTQLEAEFNGLHNQPSVDIPRMAKQRWLQALDTLVSTESVPGSDRPDPWYHSFLKMVQMYLLPAGAFASILAVGVMLGVFWSSAPEAPPPNNYSSTFAQGVRSHLQMTSQQLIALDIDNPSQRQELIDQIIDQNRLFALAAKGNGADDLARILRAFEPILKNLANTQTPSAEAIAAREQLTFELGVMQTKLSTTASKPTMDKQKRTNDV